ncbi:tetratricopeptide repeat protein 38-like [Corticium candelabrum]|uniref:tetratricopeptide repeat protein 38-like n=1 Tax=Corticium candelabrum TaxID=121492 RepID=UPI002E26692F|nr:tetratricopeptide repeat protein 38-like [Corticium candelabrum]
MLQCPLGLQYTTESKDAVLEFHKAVVALAEYSSNVSTFLDKALECDRNFIMPHVLRGCWIVTGGGLSFDEKLKACLTAVSDPDTKLTWRESKHVEAVQKRAAGDAKGAIDTWEEILLHYPIDLLATRLAAGLYFLIGDSTNIRDCLSRVLPAWSSTPTPPGYECVLGLYAFGLEESGDCRKAEEIARQALDLNPDLPWAIHALGHVYEETRPPEEGIEHMTTWKLHWIDSILSVHMTWHLCLFYLDFGDLAAVLEEYDGYMKPRMDDIFALVDGCSLLWRLECSGFSPGEERWAALTEKLVAATDNHAMAWFDLHIMMALSCKSAKDQAARLLLAKNLLDSMSEYVPTGKTINHVVTQEVGLPMCEAFLAYGNEEYDKALSLLLPVRRQTARLGWSIAQRHVIFLTVVKAAINAKNYRTALALLSELKELKPKHIATARMFSMVKEQLYQQEKK